MERQKHTIDAQGIPLGRLASEVAQLLRGKNKVEFRPNQDVGDFVLVKNFSKIKITGKKMEQKKHYRYSGYPGGITEKSLGELFEEKPDQVLRRAVGGMMPRNKLTPEQLKRLEIEL